MLVTVAMTVPGPDSSPPRDYFRSPLGIPILLAGNFAEMRDNHFHGGLDIKTRDSEGYRIYAAADGYISRVKVSPYGYGNALYVAHPNGYTTVYAHLSRFKGRIAGYVRRLQENRKTFAVDKYLEEGSFPVKKGDVIALSGNSGSSSGPHLHFEIRRTSGQIPMNPLLFGFDVPDSRPPRIFQIRLYPRSENSGVRVTTD
ncbi:MAG: M23 family metallopeptidase, partial [Rhodothermia bacterium]|nr:M23 family metallopeptidase [Rhodothermia bacterium]